MNNKIILTVCGVLLATCIIKKYYSNKNNYDIDEFIKDAIEKKQKHNITFREQFYKNLNDITSDKKFNSYSSYFFNLNKHIFIVKKFIILRKLGKEEIAKDPEITNIALEQSNYGLDMSGFILGSLFQYDLQFMSKEDLELNYDDVLKYDIDKLNLW